MGAGSPNLLVPQGFQESEQVAYTILLYKISSQNKTFEVVPIRCSQKFFLELLFMFVNMGIL
jgi:hypothetical protein